MLQLQGMQGRAGSRGSGGQGAAGRGEGTRVEGGGRRLIKYRRWMGEAGAGQQWVHLDSGLKSSGGKRGLGRDAD